MKKSYLRKFAGVQAFVLSTLFIGGCAFNDISIEKARVTDISSRMAFEEISAQGFMGGSVVYNPDNENAGQLAEGVSVAVRLGHVSKEDVGSRQAVYADLAEAAQYGLLYVRGIDEASVSFTLKLYDSQGNSLGEGAHTLLAGQSLDVNGDGLCDLEYKVPARKRRGFENAVYLNFLSSQETLNTSMFAVLPEQYARSVYPSGIIGVNPDGKFIIQKYEGGEGSARSAVYGYSKGDYVLDNLTGEYQRVTKSNSSRGARSVGDDELESVEGEVEVSYWFFAEEFVGQYEAAELLDALPETVAERASGVAGEIAKLNAVLLDRNLLSETAAVMQTAIPEDIFDEVLSQTEYLSDDELVQLNRIFLEETFPALCPEHEEVTSIITEILPLASVNFSEPLSVEENGGESCRAAVTEAEYEAKKNSIYYEYSKYKSIKSFSFARSIENEYFSVSLKDSKADIGFTGSFSITWGTVRANVEGGLYITAAVRLEAKKDFTKTIYTSPTKTVIVPAVTFGPVAVNLDLSFYMDIPSGVTLGDNGEKFVMETGFSGFYGAGFSAGLDYGIKWKKKWFIKYPSIYADFSSNAYKKEKTAYYIDTPCGDNSAVANITAYINPRLNVRLNLDVNRVVSGGIKVSPGLKPYVSISYKKETLTGTAGIDATLNIGANAYIGLSKIAGNIPLLRNIEYTNEWNNLVNYTKSLGQWTLFSKTL